MSAEVKYVDVPLGNGKTLRVIRRRPTAAEIAMVEDVLFGPLEDPLPYPPTAGVQTAKEAAR